MTFGDGGEGVVFQIFSTKKKKFENNRNKNKNKNKNKKKKKHWKHRILQQEEGLYIHNLVVRGAGNIICVHIPATESCLLNFANKRCKKCLLYELILS